MQIRKRITYTYVVLSVLSALLLCIVVLFLFRNNNEYYFLKRLQDRAKIVASIHFQNDPAKAAYYKALKSQGLEELIDEEDFVLRVHSDDTFEYHRALNLSPEFFTRILQTGNSDYENGDNRYYYGQLFKDQNGNRYIIIVTAKDRRGHLTTLYMVRIILIGGLGFAVLAYFLGRFLARRFVEPVRKIAREAKSISASNLHNRIALPESSDEIADLVNTFNGMLDRLESSFEIQSNFINNASHELKTPVTTILSEAEIILLRDRTPDQYKEALEHIHAQASKLGHLTEGLLKLSQSGYDRDQQVKDVVSVADIVKDVIESLDKSYPDHQVSLRVDKNATPSQLLIPCNRSLLELSLSNVISNATKYSDNKVVFVNVSATAKDISVSVADIGIGIPTEDIPHLYEVFFRGKKASRYEGYGLGLPLAVKIIRMHNGDIQFQSEEGKGTVARITFTRQIKNSNLNS